MKRVKTTSGHIVEVTEARAERLRKLRRAYGPELIVSPLGGGGLVATIYGHEVLRVNPTPQKEG